MAGCVHWRENDLWHLGSRFQVQVYLRVHNHWSILIHHSKPLYLSWRVIPHPALLAFHQYPELICSLQNYKRTVQVVHRDVQPTWTRHNTKRLHTLYFHKSKRNFTMLAECIHMDRRKIYALPWTWSSIEWYNWWASFSCLLFDRYFYRFLSIVLCSLIVFFTKRCI